MIKYQMMVHIKNECGRECDDDPSIPKYIVNFKHVGDSLNECFQCLYYKYKNIMKENGVDHSILANGMTITRIDTHKCTKWEDMYTVHQSNKI